MIGQQAGPNLVVNAKQIAPRSETSDLSALVPHVRSRGSLNPNDRPFWLWLYGATLRIIDIV